jgi:hypothetical protein
MIKNRKNTVFVPPWLATPTVMKWETNQKRSIGVHSENELEVVKYRRLLPCKLGLGVTVIRRNFKNTFQNLNFNLGLQGPVAGHLTNHKFAGLFGVLSTSYIHTFVEKEITGGWLSPTLVTVVFSSKKRPPLVIQYAIEYRLSSAAFTFILHCALHDLGSYVPRRSAQVERKVVGCQGKTYEAPLYI